MHFLWKVALHWGADSGLSSNGKCVSLTCLEVFECLKLNIEYKVIKKSTWTWNRNKDTLFYQGKRSVSRRRWKLWYVSARDTGVLSFNSVEACETCTSKTCHTKNRGLTLQLPRKSGIYTPDQMPIQIYVYITSMSLMARVLCVT